jgi:hypothetical protein
MLGDGDNGVWHARCAKPSVTMQTGSGTLARLTTEKVHALIPCRITGQKEVERRDDLDRYCSLVGYGRLQR